MAYAKPTIIVGENGFAGLVEPEGIDSIAYYNFSGRNERRDISADVLARAIAALLDNSSRAADVGKFGREFVMQEIDVRLGVERIEKVYRAVNVSMSLLQRAAGWGSFISALAPICYDNGAHRPKLFIKGFLKKFAADRVSV
jgi:hypothetical protein